MTGHLDDRASCLAAVPTGSAAAHSGWHEEATDERAGCRRTRSELIPAVTGLSPQGRTHEHEHAGGRLANHDDNPGRELAITNPNNSGKPARLLCLCSPAGQEDFFTRVGDPVESRTAPPPPLSPEEQDERRQRALNLAPQYATELLPGDDE